MESERDVDNRLSPMESARDTLWSNLRFGNHNQASLNNHHPPSSTASGANQNDIVDYIPESSVIIHNNEGHAREEDHQESEVYVDRETENTLTEQEVKQIIDIYNKNIDDCTKKNEELRQRVFQLQTHLKEEEQRIYSVQSEISKFKHEQVQKESQIEQVNLQIQMLSKFKEFQNQYDEKFSEQALQQRKEQLTEQLLSEGISSEQLENEITSILHLEKQVWVLEQENAYLIDLDMNLIDLEQLMKHCTQCKEEFKVSDNHDQACIFHSGKLKFFSCKGCGADEYYSCCWRCKVCSKGCKQSKHVTEAD